MPLAPAPPYLGALATYCRIFTSFVADYPVPPASHPFDDLNRLPGAKATLRHSVCAVDDWLRHEFGLSKPGRALTDPHRLDPDGFVAAVRAALPKSRKWSAAEIAGLKREYADTLVPARAAAAEILALERKLSDLVNAAYGLTPEEVALMWHTAPPRMPLDPADELRRLGVLPAVEPTA